MNIIFSIKTVLKVSDSLLLLRVLAAQAAPNSIQYSPNFPLVFWTIIIPDFK